MTPDPIPTHALEVEPAEAYTLMRGVAYTEEFLMLYLHPRPIPTFRHDTKSLEGKTILFTCQGNEVAVGEVLWVESPDDQTDNDPDSENYTEAWRLNIEARTFRILPPDNRGFSVQRLSAPPDRTQRLEKAFADQWNEENTPTPGLCDNLGLLQFLVFDSMRRGGRAVELNEGWYINAHTRRVVAHVMQWLGTNCGQGFLHAVNQKTGGELMSEFIQPQPCPVREFQREVLAMAETKFPGQPVEGKCEHLIDEAKELRDAPQDEMEMADVFLLLMQVAERAGVDLMRAARRKFEIVKARKYGPPDERGVSNHIKTETPTT